MKISAASTLAEGARRLSAIAIGCTEPDQSSMLPRFARLRKAREFRAVFASRPDSRAPAQMGASRPAADARGRVVSTAILVLHARQHRGGMDGRNAPAPVPPASLLRFGFSISKKVSKKSHDRNRLKRRLSEIARREVLPVYGGPARYDCVVVVRQGAVDADTATLRRDLHSLLRRSGIRIETAQP